ncbi:MAG: hypothetical protein DME76_08280, partial [Verrucomicrobia bacterium]
GVRSVLAPLLPSAPAPKATRRTAYGPQAVRTPKDVAKRDYLSGKGQLIGIGERWKASAFRLIGADGK